MNYQVEDWSMGAIPEELNDEKVYPDPSSVEINDINPKEIEGECSEGLEEIGGREFAAFAVIDETVEWVSGEADKEFDSFIEAVNRYVDDIYSDNIVFEEDDISFINMKDGRVRFDVELHYDPDVQGLEKELPKKLQVRGELQGQHLEDLAEYVETEESSRY